MPMQALDVTPMKALDGIIPDPDVDSKFTPTAC
jgi:hypothetical protein